VQALPKTKLTAINVGHGLCVKITDWSSDSTFVFDCGHHSSADPLLAWRRLSERLPRCPSVNTIAVSHLHYDHYSGLLVPLLGVHHDVEIVLPRIPWLGTGTRDLGDLLISRLIAIGGLDVAGGPAQIDLVRQIRRYAPACSPKPVSKGDTFTAAGETWDVLWPPRCLPSKGLAAVRKAVKGFDDLACSRRWLRDRLDAVRSSETFETLLRSSERPIDEPRPKHTLAEAPVLNLETDREEIELLRDASRVLAAAANAYSLIARSRDSQVVLTGDATKQAMKLAFQNTEGPGGDGRHAVGVTPHHGGSNHVPEAVVKHCLKAQVWISSAGGSLANHVSNAYDEAGGIHGKTFVDGDVEVSIDDGRVTSFRTGPCAESEPFW
jgi:hypothetical protein